MTAISSQPITLEEFLKLPETEPTSEYIDVELTVDLVFGWLKMESDRSASGELNFT